VKIVFVLRFTLGLPFVLAAWLLDIVGLWICGSRRIIDTSIIHQPGMGYFVVGTGNPGRSMDDFDSAAAVLRHDLYLASERERELTRVDRDTPEERPTIRTQG
jgi:hypothetical protein